MILRDLCDCWRLHGGFESGCLLLRMGAACTGGDYEPPQGYELRQLLTSVQDDVFSQVVVCNQQVRGGDSQICVLLL